MDRSEQKIAMEMLRVAAVVSIHAQHLAYTVWRNHETGLTRKQQAYLKRRVEEMERVNNDLSRLTNIMRKQYNAQR